MHHRASWSRLASPKSIAPDPASSGRRVDKSTTFDAVPDLLPALGYTDDAAVLAAALKLVSSSIRPEHRDAAREKIAAFRAS